MKEKAVRVLCRLSVLGEKQWSRRRRYSREAAALGGSGPQKFFDILDALRRVLEHFQVWIHLLDNRIDSVTYTVDAIDHDHSLRS